MSIFQEAAVPQQHSAFRNMVTVARDTRRRVAAPVKIVTARTPSRNFWQQKYFHGNPGSCHSVLVKVRFLRIAKSDSQNQTSYREPHCSVMSKHNARTRDCNFNAQTGRGIARRLAPHPACFGQCGPRARPARIASPHHADRLTHMQTRTALKRRSTATGRMTATDYRPSLVLSRSFTACGFALPPDAFIT